jgi:hypothetical protein
VAAAQGSGADTIVILRGLRDRLGLTTNRVLINART